MERTIMKRLNLIWERTDQIFNLLNNDGFYQRPILLRHPFIFYLGHLPAFLWNQLISFCPEIQHFDEELAILFGRGIDPDVDNGQVHDNSAGLSRNDWPTISCVIGFRNEVRKRAQELVKKVLTKDPTSHIELENGRIFELVCEHEMMHQETLLYMLNCLDLKFFCPNPDDNELNHNSILMDAKNTPVDTSFSFILGNKNIMIGADLNDPSIPWGWDNEFHIPGNSVDAFLIRKTPVTIKEFLLFVLDGGYHKKEFWNDDDWIWISKQNMKHPIHWREENGLWYIRIICKEIKIEGSVLHWPAQVSMAEASAWCNWKNDGSRLPTETEWYHATYSQPNDLKYRRYPWGDQNPNNEYGNFNFERLEPTPVNQFPAGRNAWGLYDLLGNGWEWTETHFAEFEGFKPFLNTYPNYSTDFFDNKHFVMRGGSFSTSCELLRPTFRNWFQRRYPYVFSKFRPVRQISLPTSSGKILKLDSIISQDQLLSEFADHVIRGLSLVSPLLSSLYLYDNIGSQIYEEITNLDEYYLTRTEYSLLYDFKKEIISIIGYNLKSLNIMEFGAGDGHKTQILLDQFGDMSIDVSYFPIDVSEYALEKLIENVKAPYICALNVDNLIGCSYLASQSTTPILATFFGSSIGNYDIPDAIIFLTKIFSLLRNGDYFLIGFDLNKNLKKLHSAYFDSKGITSRFNYNLLSRINRELNANFDISIWQHNAKWNSDINAMESWLISTEDQTVTMTPDVNTHSFHFHKGEEIRTERSYKYTLDEITKLSSESGFTIVKNFIKDDFCESLLIKNSV